LLLLAAVRAASGQLVQVAPAQQRHAFGRRLGGGIV
jgi:hypothetical protein